MSELISRALHRTSWLQLRCSAVTILLVFGGDFPAMDGADLSGINWEIAQHHMLYIMVFPLCLYHKLHYLFPCAGVLGSLALFAELLWGRGGPSGCLQNISHRDE